jgi:site-specific DNA recombinase
MRAVTAAIYSRTSHDPKGRQAAVARQESDCRRMAEDRDWLVLEPVYRENDASASTRSEKRRPVFEQLMQDVASGGVEILLTNSTSRLTRRPMEYERLIEMHSRTGMEIHTVVSGPVQLGTADGRAIARVLAVIDAAEAERISERTARTKLQRAEQGTGTVDAERLAHPCSARRCWIATRAPGTEGAHRPQGGRTLSPPCCASPASWA